MVDHLAAARDKVAEFWPHVESVWGEGIDGLAGFRFNLTPVIWVAVVHRGMYIEADDQPIAHVDLPDGAGTQVIVEAIAAGIEEFWFEIWHQVSTLQQADGVDDPQAESIFAEALREVFPESERTHKRLLEETDTSFSFFSRTFTKPTIPRAPEETFAGYVTPGGSGTSFDDPHQLSDARDRAAEFWHDVQDLRGDGMDSLAGFSFHITPTILAAVADRTVYIFHTLNGQPLLQANLPAEVTSQMILDTLAVTVQDFWDSIWEIATPDGSYVEDDDVDYESILADVFEEGERTYVRLWNESCKARLFREKVNRAATAQLSEAVIQASVPLDGTEAAFAIPYPISADDYLMWDAALTAGDRVGAEWRDVHRWGDDDGLRAAVDAAIQVEHARRKLADGTGGTSKASTFTFSAVVVVVAALIPALLGSMLLTMAFEPGRVGGGALGAVGLFLLIVASVFWWVAYRLATRAGRDSKATLKWMIDWAYWRAVESSRAWRPALTHWPVSAENDQPTER
ncbi:hypothetical protein WJX64_02870 [Leifsonia sp. YIM 134122]|uniref:Uncharacterized protein n=1 Tax=Leifsonia stereocauli TaxID=3134136 RepID=A0ABU9W0E8_9MICO